MSRYPDKAKALVEYAGAIGIAWLYDPYGWMVASYPPDLVLSSPPDVVDLLLPSVPGAICTEPGRHQVKVGGYTLTVISTPGLLPKAVSARIEGCRRLLRAMGEAPVPWVPGDGGEGGSGPAPAELRVWPPAKRGRA
jgi:hypothetical protein